MLHMFHTYVAIVCSNCFICFIQMLQGFHLSKVCSKGHEVVVTDGGTTLDTKGWGTVSRRAKPRPANRARSVPRASERVRRNGIYVWAHIRHGHADIGIHK